MKKPLNYFGYAFDKSYYAELKPKDEKDAKRYKKEIADWKKRQKIWFKQIKSRGWDNTELWNLFLTISQFIYPRLKKFYETVPHVLSKEERKMFKNALYSFDLILKGENGKDMKDYKKYLDESATKGQKGIDDFAKLFFGLWN